MSETATIPLCVDLDGTLVKLDTLLQAIFLLLRRHPVCILKLPGWAARGKAYLKEQIISRVDIDAATLPYHMEFLEFLKAEYDSGRPLVLTTASNYRTARAVADHLDIFSETLASDSEVNLKGQVKLDAIQKNYPVFSYAGNEQSDFLLWDKAQEIIMVNPCTAAKKKFGSLALHVFDDRKPGLKLWLKALRPSQWLKNVLVFLPMLLAHKFTDTGTFMQAVLAFFAFSFAASTIYVLNDLFDLSADQHHPRKRNRPFASGDLSLWVGMATIPALFLLSIGLSLALPVNFMLTLLVYFVLTTLYSWRLKQLAILDVLTLAGLYAMRVIGGSFATATVASSWFIEFTGFLFLSLALVKRYSELREMASSRRDEPDNRERGYQVEDLTLLACFGAASSYIAVFVFTLYLDSSKVMELYTNPRWLWLLCPLLLYWVTRIWLLAWRGKMDDDPLAFATTDLHTYVVGTLSILIVLTAI
ncbi:MAG: UbiA family prenyltransferase [Kiritimatiellales bacterium]|nr:UbiA family prenyltransferase [Kiritimatiellales bacterium]